MALPVALHGNSSATRTIETAGIGTSKRLVPPPARSGLLYVVALSVRRIPSGSQSKIRFSR